MKLDDLLLMLGCMCGLVFIFFVFVPFLVNFGEQEEDHEQEDGPFDSN